MQQNNKPSILYWGRELINLSIFFQKIEFMKLAVESFKNEISINFNVIYHQYSVVMPYVL